jgi:ketosteroid isomerase-like protein
MRAELALLALAGLTACSSSSSSSSPTPAEGMSAAQRSAITDSVKTVVRGVVAEVNKRNMDGAFAVYSSDADTRYVENGVTYKNLAALKKANKDLTGRLEAVKIAPDAIDVIVLGSDVAVVSAPIRVSITPNDRKAFTTTGVWSGVIQRRDGRWLVVQSHESIANPAEFAKAVASAKDKPSKEALAAQAKAAAPKAPVKKAPAKRTTTKK